MVYSIVDSKKNIMKLNVTARVRVPQKFSQEGGENPPIAEFDGEHEVVIDDPETFQKATLRLICIAGWDFSIANYDKARTLLTLATNALGTNISEVLEFVTTRFGQIPGWTIHCDRLVARMSSV